MANTKPLNIFVKQRRLELGSTNILEFARRAGISESTIRKIEARTEPPTSAYRAVWNGIAKALQVNSDELLAATKTWVADLDKLLPKEVPPISGTASEQDSALLISMSRFLINRRIQFGYTSQTQLANAMDRSPTAVNRCEVGRTKISKSMIVPYATILKLDDLEFQLATQTGKVNIEKVCLHPPYKEQIGSFGSEVYETSDISLSIMEALVEAKMPNFNLMNLFAQVEQVLGHSLSKDTWLCIIQDVCTHRTEPSLGVK